MNRKFVTGVAMVVAAGLCLAGGFVAGQREGDRRAQIQEALSKTLRREMNEARDRADALELANKGLLAQRAISQSGSEYPAASLFRVAMVQTDELVGPTLPDQLWYGIDALETRQRIIDLEREVEGLKALVSRQASSADTITAIDEDSALKSSEVSAGKSQCIAITKKGTRCSRVAKSNGKCWQHGG